MSQDKDS